MPGSDGNSLSAEQQEKLNDKKVLLRVENERYLREHPELKQLLNGFFIKTLNEKPENVEEYAAKFFTDERNYATLQ